MTFSDPYRTIIVEPAYVPDPDSQPEPAPAPKPEPAPVPERASCSAVPSHPSR